MAWVAILAIALQTVFAGFAGSLAMAAPFDPAAIICHGSGSDPSSDGQSPLAEHDCCSHCVLCSKLPVGPGTDSFRLFVPPRQTATALVPFSAIEPPVLTALASNSARGPPRGV